MLVVTAKFPFFRWDPQVQAGVVVLSKEPPVETVRLKVPGKKRRISVDLDQSGEIVSIEILPR